MRRPQHRRPLRRRPGEAPATHRVWLSPDQPLRETAPDGKTYFRIRLDAEPSPEWMRAYRAGLLGLVPEDRDAVLRFEFQGDNVRIAATDAEIEVLAYEIEAYLRWKDGRPRAASATPSLAPAPSPATSRVKAKIVRALRNKR